PYAGHAAELGRSRVTLATRPPAEKTNCSGPTLYSRVAQDLAEAIGSGRYPVGALLPTEMELCEHYGTSRPTVRLALQELQGMGLVSRRKHVGTRVESRSPSGAYTQSIASLDGLVQLAEDQERVVKAVDEVVADRALARELGCTPGSKWVRMQILRLDRKGDTLPIGWTDAYLDPAYADIPKLLKESPTELVSSLIESKFGKRVAEVEQTICAISLAAGMAESLNAGAGTPGLKIIRRYLDKANEAFEITVTVHPADRMQVSMRLRRDRP
ncbi:GntR family transcriptional regulator, partial [Caballeronia udeis]